MVADMLAAPSGEMTVMKRYAWPAEVSFIGEKFRLVFPDWPDIKVEEGSAEAAHRQAICNLSAEVNKRIETTSNLPDQSESGPNSFHVLLDVATSARLERYLKDGN